jgi:hypothetical protein
MLREKMVSITTRPDGSALVPLPESNLWEAQTRSDARYFTERHDMKSESSTKHDVRHDILLWHLVVRDTSTLRDLVLQYRASIRVSSEFPVSPDYARPIFHNYCITRIILGTHTRCKSFFNGGSVGKWRYFIWRKQNMYGMIFSFSSWDHEVASVSEWFQKTTSP